MSDYEVQYLMTTDKEHTVQTTSTPAEQQAAHADFVLIGLAEQVANNERTLTAAIDRARDILEQAEAHRLQGRRLNQLGILQSSGPAVDVAVAAFEASVAAFTTAHNYLGKAFPFQGNPQATQDAFQRMLDEQIRRSPRLQEIVR